MKSNKEIVHYTIFDLVGDQVMDQMLIKVWNQVRWSTTWKVENNFIGSIYNQIYEDVL
jgi:hypothetical protein